MSQPSSTLRAALVTALAVAVAACATRQPLPPPEEPDSFERADYVIGPSDVLSINVWKNPELSVQVPVRPDGKVSMPLLDDVQAAGLTTRELKELVTDALSKYIAAPDVTVIVSQVNSKRVYVVGEVARPSAIPLTLDMRALDAIVAAGGFNAFASKGKVKILRPAADGNVLEYRFDYPAFLRGEHPESNMQLRPGDTIVVPD